MVGVIIYLYFVFFIIAILTDFLPFSALIKNISQLGTNSLRTIRSPIIDDSDKERILLVNSLKMFKQSLKMTGFIILIAFCGILLLLPGSFFKSLNYRVLLDFLVTYTGIFLTLASFFSYFLLKKLYVKIRL